jgi:Ca2+-binding RTX toxin-like protein
MLIEPLESRRLLAGVATLVNGRLTVTGTSGDDWIDFYNTPTQFVVRVNDQTRSYAFARSAVTSAVINAGAGSDYIGVTIDYGDDRITVNGGAGNDMCDAAGNPFNSVLFNGNDGNDTAYLRDGAAINYDFVGGAGSDLARFHATQGNDRVVARTDGRISGAIGNNLRYGDAETIHVYLLGGDDSFSGNYLPAGRRFTAFGGAGNDYMTFGGVAAPVTLRGGGGNDSLFGGTRRDLLMGEDGNDYLWSRDASNVDSLYGGAGKDFADVDATDFVQGVETIRR